MKHMNLTKLAGCVLAVIFIAGCGSSPVVVNQEASKSAIRAAEEVGATDIANASLYLQLAKEELANSKILAANGEKEQAESMLSRSQADGELAIALSHSDADKKEAALAVERVQKLRQDNKLPKERK
ncbi:MAG: hypothetical protein NTX65_03830 [Ignavibacteriales bacterium]|nr:hypothetical protein [Ignavibacteriales bacterium]